MATKHCEFVLMNDTQCNADLGNSMLNMCMPHFILSHYQDEDLGENEVTTCIFPVIKDGVWQRCGADQTLSYLCCSEHAPMSSASMMQRCGFFMIGGKRCLGDCQPDSPYCHFHFMAESDYDGQGCVIGKYKTDGIERCGKEPWHSESRYCKAHAKSGADEGLGKPEGCQYILTKGPRQGQKCGISCEGGVCKMHDPNKVHIKAMLIGAHPTMIKKL